jgi:hypothetical protein
MTTIQTHVPSLELCSSCNCMTSTISIKCGKCGAIKELSTEAYVTEPEREDAMSTEQQPFEGFKSR